MHDILRDLCLREAKKDKFLWVNTVHNFDIQSQRRISINGSESQEFDKAVKALPLASLARSFMCYFNGICSFYNFRLVRIIKTVDKYTFTNVYTEYSLKDTFKLVNVKYLAVTVDWYLNSVFPSSMHLLWNLQTLIIKGDQSSRGIIKVPPKIWRMFRPRHLEIDSWFSLPDPPNVPLTREGDGDDFILRNLQTLKRVKNFNLSEEMVKRIPNIKKLQVGYLDYRWWHNLGLLNKLESLYIDYSFGSDPSFRIEFLQNIAFPHSLKKLTLCGTHFLWKDMRMIGSLPHLQVLKLSYGSFRGREWNPVEGEFLCLKFLLIEGCDHLEYWNANPTNFPCLEQLVLKYLGNLTEIPLDFGQISTLVSIEVWDCKNSLVMSAKNVLDEQVKLGNEDLRVRVNGNPQFSS